MEDPNMVALRLTEKPNPPVQANEFHYLAYL